MRASVLRGRRMAYRDDLPEPGPGQVLVAVKACGLCGSDLHFAKHGAEMLAASAELEGMPATGPGIDLGADVFMGHEFSAEVLDAGPDTDAPPPGTLVTSIPVLLSRAGPEMIVCRGRSCCRCPTGSTSATPRSPNRWPSACMR